MFSGNRGNVCVQYAYKCNFRFWVLWREIGLLKKYLIKDPGVVHQFFQM